MTEITSSSTFKDVVDANPITESAKDLESWNILDLPAFNEDNDLFNYIYVGVFGYDLLNFFTDCVTATTYCDYDTLVAAYDGWAIGSYMYVSYDALLDTLMEGFCLPDLSCIGFYL